MAIEFNILNLAAFTVGQTVEPGNLYIDKLKVGVLSNLNDYRITVELTGHGAPLIFENFRNVSAAALTLAVPTRIIARPLSPLTKIADLPKSIAGFMFPAKDGPAICSLFAIDKSANEPDRTAVNLATLFASFHDREMQFGYEHWAADWVNTQTGDVVLTVTNQAPSAAHAEP
jgi:hypothetical protein